MKYRVKYQCMFDVKGPTPLGKVKSHILGYVMKSFQSKVCLNFWQLNAIYIFILKPSTNLQKTVGILQLWILCHTSPLPNDFKQVGIETNSEVTYNSNYINPSYHEQWLLYLYQILPRTWLWCSQQVVTAFRWFKYLVKTFIMATFIIQFVSMLIALYRGPTVEFESKLATPLGII